LLTTVAWCCLEATVGFEPTHEGFADPWVARTPEDQGRISSIDQSRLPPRIAKRGMAELDVQVRASDRGPRHRTGERPARTKVGAHSENPITSGKSSANRLHPRGPGRRGRSLSRLPPPTSQACPGYEGSRFVLAPVRHSARPPARASTQIRLPIPTPRVAHPCARRHLESCASVHTPAATIQAHACHGPYSVYASAGSDLLGGPDA
jgi:hypothetical protein